MSGREGRRGLILILARISRASVGIQGAIFRKGPTAAGNPKGCLRPRDRSVRKTEREGDRKYIWVANNYIRIHKKIYIYIKTTVYKPLKRSSRGRVSTPLDVVRIYVYIYMYTKRDEHYLWINQTVNPQCPQCDIILGPVYVVLDTRARKKK